MGDTSNLDLLHIRDRKVRDKLSSLIASYKPHKAETVRLKLQILLKDKELIRAKPRHFTAVEKAIIDKRIKEWLEEGIIRETISPYFVNLVLVSKKD